jgi:hypothetical protein
MRSVVVGEIRFFFPCIFTEPPQFAFLFHRATALPWLTLGSTLSGVETACAQRPSR